MTVTSIDNYETFGTVIRSETPVIVYFWTQWCPPCKTIGPTFEEFSNREENARLKFYKIDKDRLEIKPAISEWQIPSVPSFLVYRNGERLDQLRGASRPGLEVCSVFRGWIHRRYPL
ncbi:thioredoxin-like protein [Mycena capillaripes]|nr:thioredoxin-like protein [Mycena capillaripes]